VKKYNLTCPRIFDFKAIHFSNLDQKKRISPRYQTNSFYSILKQLSREIDFLEVILV